MSEAAMRKEVVVKTILIILFALAVAYDTAASRGFVSGSSPKRVAATNVSQAASAETSERVMNTSLFRTIAKRENPVVVFITVQSRTRTPDMTQFFGGDDFFWRFFGGPAQPHEQIQRGLGSGFVITHDGEILTNNHVVAGAQQIRVGLYGDDHKTYPAEVVGRDPLTDSALIKLKSAPTDLPTANLGDSDALEPGDWVMAIGNPFQLGHTVTVGVVSYKGRPFAVSEGRFQNMLQTDASINPGNSGGPLINVQGEVVGINSAILSGEGGGGNIGIGFAVPINTVKALLPQLRQGKVHRSQLGVQIQSRPVTDDEAKELGLPRAEGAIVSMVQHDSAAERAGLQAGDVITEYNGKPVSDADSLTAMVVDTPAGTRVPIVFYRHGSRQTASVTVEEQPFTRHLHKWHFRECSRSLNSRLCPICCSASSGLITQPRDPRFSLAIGDPEHFKTNLPSQSETSEPPGNSQIARAKAGSRIALRECERGELGRPTQFGAGDPPCTVVFHCFCPPLDACLQQGGDGGVNITAQRLERSAMFTPSPVGAGTARPADLSGQLQSR
jgi:serine protease Do